MKGGATVNLRCPWDGVMLEVRAAWYYLAASHLSPEEYGAEIESIRVTRAEAARGHGCPHTNLLVNDQEFFDEVMKEADRVVDAARDRDIDGRIEAYLDQQREARA